MTLTDISYERQEAMMLGNQSGRRCETDGCDRPSVGIHRVIGPSDRLHPDFGTTTAWEDACEQHFGTVVVRGQPRHANRTHRYGEST